MSVCPGSRAACSSVTWSFGTKTGVTSLRAAKPTLTARRRQRYQRGAGGLGEDPDGFGHLAGRHLHRLTPRGLSQVPVQLQLCLVDPAVMLPVAVPQPSAVVHRRARDDEVDLRTNATQDMSE